MSIAELASNYKLLADAILNAGPLVSDNLDDLKLICEAASRIRERTIKHFGLSGGEVLTDEELEQLLKHPDVVTANGLLAGGVGADGVKGPFVDVLMQLIQLAMQNPQLLQLILALFQKTTT